MRLVIKTVRIPILSALSLLVFINFATVGMGKYLVETGKLAVSNITPVVYIMFGFPAFYIARKAVSKNAIGFLLAFNALAWISFLTFALRFGWEPNLPVLYFQEIEIVFALILIWYGRTHFDQFLVTARYGTICSAIISIFYGLQQIKVAGFLLLTFGMDDKSQAAVMFCCQAFILLRYFGGPLDMLFAGILMVMSLTTLSRLPVFFLPVMFLALAKRSAILATIAGFAAIGGFIFVLSAGDSVQQFFKVIDRLSSLDTVKSDDATSAHFLLIQSALQMKFTDIYAFFLGTGPGNFSKALINFPISKDQLEAIDPALISEARLNRAPMHSTPVSALLDYNLALFALLGVFLLKGLRYLVDNARYIELMFFGALFLASMFYSLHNKPYLFLVCASIAVLSTQRKNRVLSLAPLGRSGQVFAHATIAKVTNK